MVSLILTAFPWPDSENRLMLTNHSIWGHESLLLVWACRDYRWDDGRCSTGTNMTQHGNRRHIA